MEASNPNLDMAWPSALQHFFGSASETKLCHVAWPRGQQLSAKSCRWTGTLKRFLGWTYGKKGGSRQSLSHLIPSYPNAKVLKLAQIASAEVFCAPRGAIRTARSLRLCLIHAGWYMGHLAFWTWDARAKGHCGMYTKLAVLSFTGPSESIWELFRCSQPVLIFFFGTTAKSAIFCHILPQLSCNLFVFLLLFSQGLVNVPFWGYWTSPYSSHYRPYT